MTESLPFVPSQTFDFARYLAAKSAIDDRSLNHHVYSALCDSLPTHGDGPLRILEVGCGTGTMVQRLAHWGFFSMPGCKFDYLGIDADASLVQRATENPDDCGPLVEADAAKYVHFITAEIGEFAADPQHHHAFDLLIANAVLDLLDLESALLKLGRLLRPACLAWFTINFDGVTHFEPPCRPGLDALIEQVYHATMDERVRNSLPSGDSRTGRHMLTTLVDTGYEIVAAGASDWLIFPTAGRYRGEEAYFLSCIVEMVRSALEGDWRIPAADLAEWHADRQRQIQNGRLSYMAHQVDYLVRTLCPPQQNPETSVFE